ncbi:MAG TPA: hypothetical protein VGD34_10050 [Kribbella sp.]
MRFRTRVAAVVATLPLVLGIAACSGEQKQATGNPPTATPTATATTTTAAPLNAVQPVAHLNRVTFLPALQSGLATQKSWRMSAKMTAGGQTVMTITGVQQAKPPAMSAEISGEAFKGGKARMVLANGFLYLSMPGLTPAGKYVKVDPKASGDLSSLLDGADPTKTFKVFGVALRNVRFVRSETIDGAKLDRYTISVDTASALRLQGKAMPAGAPKTLDYTIWVGADKVMRRMSFDTAGIKMLMTMTPLSTPVTIKAPPARSIVKR